MKFVVLEHPPSRADRQPGTVYLWQTDWDDWFKFSTSHFVLYIDEDGEEHQLGVTKIGEFGLKGASVLAERKPGYRSPTLPKTFETLGTEHFSLGQDTSYYSDLTKISAQFRDNFLRALNDIALDDTLRARAQSEPVTGVSLLREVPLKTLQDQYHRLARGGAKLTAYEFEFYQDQQIGEEFRIGFAVKPRSTIPTNIHVLIGRNGVGKSTILHSIARAVVMPDRIDEKDQRALYGNDGIGHIANVVSVSFSAFDVFEPLPVPQDQSTGLSYHYVGLKKKRASARGSISKTKDLAALSSEMTTAAKACLRGARRPRWFRALRLLESDPIFAAIGLVDLLEEDEVDTLDDFASIFGKLSSGHKIVLLTVTKLVQTVQERSLVLIDEPEAHLHPPLLSALVRALSDLLNHRNGVAIIATHSPVVLQEVPRSCAWKIQRSGTIRSADRPLIETFGENVGTLTDEVFGLEVSATGFHKMLADAVVDMGDYDEILEALDGQLGSEGRALLRAMTVAKARGKRVDL